MEVTLSLFQVSFYAAIAFTILGGIFGLMGVWIKEFWESEAAWNLIFTDFILAGTSIVVAVITKFLGYDMVMAKHKS